MNTLPAAAVVQGAMLEERGAPQQRFVVVQYTDHKGELCELELPFDGAMKLLAFLREAEKDASSWNRSS
jgi:hypothetical protein